MDEYGLTVRVISFRTFLSRFQFVVRHSAWKKKEFLVGLFDYRRFLSLDFSLLCITVEAKLERGISCKTV